MTAAKEDPRHKSFYCLHGRLYRYDGTDEDGNHCLERIKIGYTEDYVNVGKDFERAIRENGEVVPVVDAEECMCNGGIEKLKSAFYVRTVRKGMEQ